MSTLVHRIEPLDTVDRLRRVLTDVQLDCQCQTTLNGVLDRFSDRECRERIRESLRVARRQRDWISGQLSYLVELDDMSELERDHTVFEELALLFDEIGIAATKGARAIREVRPENLVEM